MLPQASLIPDPFGGYPPDGLSAYQMSPVCRTTLRTLASHVRSRYGLGVVGVAEYPQLLTRPLCHCRTCDPRVGPRHFPFSLFFPLLFPSRAENVHNPGRMHEYRNRSADPPPFRSFLLILTPRSSCPLHSLHPLPLRPCLSLSILWFPRRSKLKGFFFLIFFLHHPHLFSKNKTPSWLRTGKQGHVINHAGSRREAGHEG